MRASPPDRIRDGTQIIIRTNPGLPEVERESLLAGKRKEVITIETRKLTVVRSLRAPINAWCEQCHAEVLMVTPERAATILGTAPREIYRRVENGELHFLESTDGALHICCREL